MTANKCLHEGPRKRGKRRITQNLLLKSPEAPPCEPKIPTTTDMNIDLIWTLEKPRWRLARICLGLAQCWRPLKCRLPSRLPVDKALQSCSIILALDVSVSGCRRVGTLPPNLSSPYHFLPVDLCLSVVSRYIQPSPARKPKELWTQVQHMHASTTKNTHTHTHTHRCRIEKVKRVLIVYTSSACHTSAECGRGPSSTKLV